MPDPKVFNYTMDGLSYSVTVYEEDGKILADIEMLEGSMDVNAVYFGDDDYSGSSTSLGGPLNMNGAQYDGEKVQWDGASYVSDPGLGPDADEKESYIHAGDTLTLELDADSLDDIDIFGIRATSTTTDAGSIKAVSGDPEEPEEPEDPDEPTFDKVLFGTEVDESGNVIDGITLTARDDPASGIQLPEGTEPTFDNYLAFFDEEVEGYDVESLETIRFFTTSPEGWAVQVGELPAPEDGWTSVDDVLEDYDALVDSGAFDTEDPGAEGLSLIAALSTGDEEEDAPVEEEPEPEAEMDLV